MKHRKSKEEREPEKKAREPTEAPPAEVAPGNVSVKDVRSFPIVGIGASAGGLEAFTQLLRALPDKTGMAFVLVQHLSPTHESSLAQILSHATQMPVTEVSDEPEILPDRVYVIPPNRSMEIDESRLKLFGRESQGRHHPIDQFLVSLARNRGHLAIGVILSGTATDGTLGLEEVKAEGGLTFAQDASAQYPGMPQSAVASGCVDFVLSPAAIAAELARIAEHPWTELPAVEPIAKGPLEGDRGKQSLASILHVLRTSTGVDFSQYKVNTLLRRIRRRMVVLKLEQLDEYAQHLRQTPAEAQSLYQDILINVTSFFRDPATFAQLGERVIPKLLEGRSRHDPLRVWVLGCSTGEEAYSLAMLLTEVLESSAGHAPPQIFATDLNANGIDKARAGVYSADRLHDVSRERLRRFFTEQNGKHQVTKSLRDMCVFSRHNVMSDPPFSRMDLVSCRNLLIYMEPVLQQRILPLLHYALKPNGHLVLGASETVGRFRDLFEAEDPRHRIFARKPGGARLPVPALGRSSGSLGIQPATRSLESGAAALTGRAAQHAGVDPEREADRLLIAYAPPSVLVDASFDILQYRGKVDPYLSPAQGKATHALLKMVREGLLAPLRSLLGRAKEQGARVHAEGVRIQGPDGAALVDLEVVPVRGRGQESSFLVLFHEAPMAREPEVRSGRPVPPPAGAAADSAEATIARLEHELADTRDQLQELLEQYNAASEEMQSTSEEMQSTNEELQSINEELETSKEEIQSSNEELTTLNDELQSRNLETGRLNSDLTNLITSVSLPIVIVGRDLRIRRFSPKAEQLLNIIPSDIGRPLTDIRTSLDMPVLDELLSEVTTR